MTFLQSSCGHGAPGSEEASVIYHLSQSYVTHNSDLRDPQTAHTVGVSRADFYMVENSVRDLVRKLG